MKAQRIREYLANRQSWRCFYCKRRMSPTGKGHLREVTLDHVHPKSEGGRNAKANYVAACKVCNEAKATLSAPAFLEVLAIDRAAAGDQK